MAVQAARQTENQAMDADKQNYDNVKQMTAVSLHKLIETTEQLTHLSLPERTALVEEISRVLPAGNIPSLVAAGLAKVPGRSVSPAENRRNLSLLLQGMQTFLDKAVFQTFYVGPATVLSAYQMLLKLAGKDIEESFPEGTWQFYVEFGLREDSGRHACETVGFQEALEVENIKLSPADEMTCWVAASQWLLDRYHVLLANEWTEHVRLKHIQAAISDRRVIDKWVKSRPYAVPHDINIDFTQYRQMSFEAFCNGVLNDINPRLRRKIDDAWNDPKAVGLRAQAIATYQRQMTMLATLHPSEHSDSRSPLSRNQLSMAVVSGGRYYLVDLAGMVALDDLRPHCAAILQDKPDIPTASLDKLLSTARRRDQVALRKAMPDFLKAEIERLRHAPIILNWDTVNANNSLLDIRSGRRGVGDHAMTIFRTNESAVFDLSHIFFDGPWGMAVAEILTGQAIRYARQLHKAAVPKTLPTLHCLDLEAPQGFAAAARKVQLLPEVSGETSGVDLILLQQVRQSLHKRNNKVNLTVNDMLIMFRCVFNQIYQPSTDLMNTLRDLAYSKDQKVVQAAEMALTALEEARHINPALLIPIDASGVDPRERIFPTTFRNPFNNLLKQHRNAIASLDAMESANLLSKPLAYRYFEEARREYLMTINAFGQVIAKHKDVSLAGESVSTATIRLLGGLPQNVQRMLDALPDTFDVINDIVKGQEVFSNVGRVSISSSLKRFNTAKDDNEKKVLAWGFLTDAKGEMHISLRDSRPHVAALFNAKLESVAHQLTQEFVDAYALKLNNFLEDLIRITRMRNE